MSQTQQLHSVFGKKITDLGHAESVDAFLGIISKKLKLSDDFAYFYRGEAMYYEETSLKPQLFRETKWIENEHKMINDFVAKFPSDFPKGTSTFDIIINADHFSLPTRVLDISYSAFTGLFMSCYNFSSSEKVDDKNDGFVYIFKVRKKDIKNWNSDSVTLLSNLARMDAKFPYNEEWKKSIDILMHTIKDEKPDFYTMYGEQEMEKYKEDFNNIVCVKPKMLNARITNQKGLFFLFGINGTKMDYDNMKFDKDVEIYYIRIPRNCKKHILGQLEICGYDRMTMFPDMQNVCESIKENYKLN